MRNIEKIFNKYTSRFFKGVSSVAVFCWEGYFFYQRKPFETIPQLTIKELLLKTEPSFQNILIIIETLHKCLLFTADKFLEIESEGNACSASIEKINQIYSDTGFASLKNKFRELTNNIVSLKNSLEKRNQLNKVILQKTISIYEQICKLIFNELREFFIATTLEANIEKRTIAITTIEQIYKKLPFIYAREIQLSQICQTISENFLWVISTFLNPSESIAYLLSWQKSAAIPPSDVFFKLQKAFAEKKPTLILNIISNTDRETLEGLRFENGDTLLHWAAQHSNTDEIISSLLNKEFNPNLLNYYDETVLHFLARFGRHKVLRSLIQAGAIIRANYLQKTPLHLAAEFNHLECLKILLENGAKANPIDFFDKTPLHYAANTSNIVMVKILLTHEVELTLHDLSGWIPLHIAAGRGNIILIDLLMPDDQIMQILKSPSYNYETPMHIAVMLDRPDIILKLHQKEIAVIDTFKGTEQEATYQSYLSINRRNHDGNTPLHLAKLKKFDQCEKILQSLDANETTKNKEGYTAADYVKIVKTNNAIEYFSEKEIKDDKSLLLNRCKSLHSVFGDFYIPLWLQQAGINFLEGGNADVFTIELLTQMLPEFFKKQGLDVKNIHDYFTTIVNPKNLDTKKIITEMSQKPDFCLLILGRTETHAFPITIQQEKRQIILTIFDRSGFFSYSHIQSNKITPVAKFRFATNQPKQMLIFEHILSLIKDMPSHGRYTANAIFSIKLPKFVPLELDWNILQTQYETDTCFYENYKILFKNAVFIKQFGENKGLLLYQQFDIFVLIRFLDNFKLCEGKIDSELFNRIVTKCQGKITHKNSKLKLQDNPENDEHDEALVEGKKEYDEEDEVISEGKKLIS